MMDQPHNMQITTRPGYTIMFGRKEPKFAYTEIQVSVTTVYPESAVNISKYVTAELGEPQSLICTSTDQSSSDPKPVYYYQHKQTVPPGTDVEAIVAVWLAAAAEVKME